MATTEPRAALKYAQTHEWVRVEGRTAYIGISAYAQDELGDVVFLDLPWNDAGSRDFKAGQRFGDIESVKATSELFAPVSGTLTQVNAALQDHAELVNSDPFGDGWMLAIEMSEPTELDRLMDADAYTEFLKTAGH